MKSSRSLRLEYVDTFPFSSSVSESLNKAVNNDCLGVRPSYVPILSSLSDKLSKSLSLNPGYNLYKLLFTSVYYYSFFV
jgi:hypothetical protein